jgi:uncharacterized membrane protein
LLILLYWVGAELYLIDCNGDGAAPWQAIVISALSLTLGWVAYDLLCKSKLGDNPTLLMVLLFGIIVVWHGATRRSSAAARRCCISAR